MARAAAMSPARPLDGASFPSEGQGRRPEGAPSDPAPPPVVRVDALLKRYRRREAVRGVSLQVARGEIYGVIGPDGAGKSSLFKAVAGVLAFEGGRVELFGRPVGSEREAEQVQPRIG